LWLGRRRQPELERRGRNQNIGEIGCGFSLSGIRGVCIFMNNFWPSYYLKAEITEQTQTHAYIIYTLRKDARREAQVCSNAPEDVLARSACDSALHSTPAAHQRFTSHAPTPSVLCAAAANFPQHTRAEFSGREYKCIHLLQGTGISFCVL
jgi:hypothetical protein